MSSIAPALPPDQFLRSANASRDTLGRPRIELLDVVARVSALTGNAPYAVIGGLAQILWARKSHTGVLDVALAAPDLGRAYQRIRDGTAPGGWALPKPPDPAHEADDVFQVYHLMCEGSVVDLIAFQHVRFNAEILSTAQAVPELGNIRFIRPDLLLVTHLLRPGPSAALAAVELVIARKTSAQLDLDQARRWATEVGRAERLDRVLAQAAALDLI